MRTISHWFFSVAMFLVATMMYSQGIVSGTIYEADTKQPLPGANVLIKGTTQGVSTDFDGKFSLNVKENKGTLVISYVGFENASVPFVISNGKANVSAYLVADAQSLSEVVVTGVIDIVKERQTPVAVSTIKASEIIERLGNKEFPEILNRTPSVYATKQGGGFGDSKINIRGFANENIAVMVNGMPVNDMENGRVFWSNWAGLSDVTSATQVQRGLGASKLAIASIGGTINVITRSSEMSEGGVAYTSYGNNAGNHEYKGLLAYNTGKSKSGWSSSILLSRTWGQKYADATQFEGYNYFFALGYTPSEKHNLQFMITGAPQWHNQRSSSVAISDAIRYEGSADKPNRKYNSDWGYLDGKEYNNRRNVYHKPIMMLNWDWAINESSTLSTVAYASFGRGFGTGDLGSVGGKKIRNFRDTKTGLYDFDKIVQENKTTTPDKGVLIRRASINSHDWYGILTNFNHKIDKNFTISMGLDGRYYYGYHYQTPSDLWGASAYADKSNKNLTAPNYVTSTIKDTPNYNPFSTRIDPIDNRIAYSNDGEVRWMGLFAQLEYTDDKFSAFVQGSSSIQGFQRIDEFVKPGTLAVRGNPATEMNRKTGFKDLLGYNIKGGANYNINEQHNVFGNIGFYSKQPFFNAVYPNNKNFLNPNLTNEKIFGIELGYGFKSSIANLNVNLYRTSWKDRFVRKTNDVKDSSGNTIRAYASVLGVTEIHQGIELEGNIKPTDYLTFRGSLSIGNWFYKGNAFGDLFNESNEPIDGNGNVVPAGSAQSITLYLDNVKVGDSAQQTASLGATIEPINKLRFNVDWRYVNHLYANLNVTNFTTEKEAQKGALQLPSFNLFDLTASYQIGLTDKQSLTISANIDNVLDTYYIAESYDNKHAKTLADFKDDATKGTAQQQFDTYQNTQLYKGVDTSNRVYFGTGRTWSLSLRYKF